MDCIEKRGRRRAVAVGRSQKAADERAAAKHPLQHEVMHSLTVRAADGRARLVTTTLPSHEIKRQNRHRYRSR
jgi:hypothetical protein